MTNAWGHTNFDDVADVAPQFGMAELGEARYLREDVGGETIGLSLYHLRPNRRTGFGHRHVEVEEMYVVLGGSGRVKIDDDLVELCSRDVVRVAPAAVREFEAGPDGLELLATGTHVEGDGELLQGWWPDEA